MFSPDDIPDFAIAGDWHGNLRYIERALMFLKNKEKDVVIHLGDLGTLSDPHNFIGYLTENARRADIIVAFIDGNHENFEWLLRHPVDADGIRRLSSHVWHLPRGYRWEWGGVKFLALGGAYSIDQEDRVLGVDRFLEETITVGDMHEATQGGEVDVMFTHDAPNFVTIPGLLKPSGFPYQDELESEMHRSNLGLVVDTVKPKYLFHGHFHIRYSALRKRRDFVTYVHGLDMDGTPFPKNMITDITVVDFMIDPEKEV